MSLPGPVRRLVVCLCSIALLASCTGTGTEPSSEDAQAASTATIRLGDQSWETLWINNSIVSFIIEHGYERDVEVISTSTPVMQQALVQDDLDIVMEIYPQNIAEWWDQVREDGTVVDLGEIMEESRRGLYVPRYVVEGDDERDLEALAPDLRHIEDLARYAHLFPDPEDEDKGQIISCIIGWACLDAVAAKVDVYELDEHYNLLEPGSGAAMDAAIVSAYRAGEPVVFYYWEPTWLVGEFDLIQLEMDAWTEECEAASVAIIERGEEPSDDARCAFPQPPVSIAASAGFVDRDPQIAAFLEEMFLGIDRVGELAAWMASNDAEPDEVALHYLTTYPEEWASWLPDDVAEKVSAALPS